MLLVMTTVIIYVAKCWKFSEKLLRKKQQKKLFERKREKATYQHIYAKVLCTSSKLCLPLKNPQKNKEVK